MTQVAQTPKAPIRPKPMRNILLGLILGLFGGVGCAFFVEYLDNTIKDPEEAERRFGVSVIGGIELLKKGKNPDLEARQEPASSFAESYKSLRTNVLLSSAEQPPKRLMITSMSPKEGKTTTALNLARALAQTERKVLLVDADLRRPRLHKAFQLENSTGLSSFLSGTTQEVTIQPTDEVGLSVLNSGPVPPNPSELLGSKRFSDLLEQLEPQFDILIIDSPPILSATDSLLISKLSEGVIVVCLTAQTTYDRLQHGLKSLMEINSNVLGLVLNAMDMKKSNYYSYYGYYQYYTAEKE
jgi:capsular exopolysaccharide synthesis family protein